MSRSTREQLIERYLRGDLSAAEEERFFIEVAANAELRQELKAYRIVDETLSVDSARHAVPQTALRAHLQTQMAGAAAPATAASTATTAGTGAAATVGTVSLQWIIAAAVTAILVAGGVIAGVVLNRPTDAVDPSHQPATPNAAPAHIRDDRAAPTLLPSLTDTQSVAIPRTTDADRDTGQAGDHPDTTGPVAARRSWTTARPEGQERIEDTRTADSTHDDTRAARRPDRTPVDSATVPILISTPRKIPDTTPR